MSEAVQDDLVERLRDMRSGTGVELACALDDLCLEAAAEIARLRAAPTIEHGERNAALALAKEANDRAAQAAMLQDMVDGLRAENAALVAREARMCEALEESLPGCCLGIKDCDGSHYPPGGRLPASICCKARAALAKESGNG